MFSSDSSISFSSNSFSKSFFDRSNAPFLEFPSKSSPPSLGYSKSIGASSISSDPLSL
jgi:hypothetical protein